MLGSTLAAILALGLASQCVARPGIISPKPRLSIIGGSDAVPHELPWQVGLVIYYARWNFSELICGGSLLSANHALTAAHCVGNTNSRVLKVVAGWSHEWDTDGVTSQVAEYHKHELFEGGFDELSDNDIAILVLATPIHANGRTIQYASLPDDDDEDFTGRRCVMSGWGLTDAGVSSETLRKGNVSVISASACNSLLYPVGQTVFAVDRNQICVHDELNETTACEFDSGGPLTCYYPTEHDSRQVVAGVGATYSASFQNTDETRCNPHRPSVYTRTSRYLSWIRSILFPPPPTSPPECCPCTPRAVLLRRPRLDDVSTTRQGFKPRPKLTIAGGRDAIPHEFPWLLDMQINFFGWRHLCGASLLSPNYALTAAHCLVPIPGMVFAAHFFRVIAGSHNYSMIVNGTVSKVTSLIPHELFNYSTSANDIAILMLTTPIFANGHSIDYAALPANNDDQLTGRTCVISGWGFTSAIPQKFSEILQKGSIRVISNSTCKERVADISNATIDNNHICVQDVSHETGACGGDSGGPLTCNYPTEHDARRVVAGVASWADAVKVGNLTRCNSHRPSVYTRTSAYLYWIQSTTSPAPLPTPSPCCPCTPARLHSAL